MRLLVLGPGHPYRGGIARTTTELVRALGKRGHGVEFFTPRRQYPRWLYPGGDDRDPEACPRVEASRAVLDPMAPWSWPAVRREALEVAAAAWIVPYWTWVWAGQWRWLLGSGQRPPAVAVVHNLADHDGGRARRLAARSVLGRCEAMFTHAGNLADQIETSFPGVPVASHPIPPPLVIAADDRVAARSALGLPQDCRVALFFGLVRPYKGVDLLLEAFATVPDRENWRLVVAGEPWGGLGTVLKRRVRELEIDNLVRLDLRWIPESEVSALLAAADVAVLPYRSGSQSAVAPIALAGGVPVVVTAVGGLPEVVKNGVNGLLVEPGSIDSLAKAFEALDRGRLDLLAAGARAWRGRFTWDSYAAALERLIDRVIHPVPRSVGEAPQKRPPCRVGEDS